MIDPNKFFGHVDFEPHFDQETLDFDQKRGFWQVEDTALAVGKVRILGFGTPLSRYGGMCHADVFPSLTNFSDLPFENRTIDEQGKGVGPRMYNTRECFGGARERPETIGVYIFDLDPDPRKLLDGRSGQGSTLERIQKHARRIAEAKNTSVAETVDAIHAGYGDADAVQLEMPPHPRLRQLLHRVINPEGVKPQFILIRNPRIILRRVGTTSSPW